MKKMLKKCVIVISFMFVFLTLYSTTVMAGCDDNYSQQYDADTGIDSWLSNYEDWYPAIYPKIGHYSIYSPPLATIYGCPDRGFRKDYNQNSIPDDNFEMAPELYGGQEWLWNLPQHFTYLPHTRGWRYNIEGWGYGPTGEYRDGGSDTPNEYMFAFVNFYKRPKPNYQGCEAPRLADLSRQMYHNGNTYWVKTNDSVVFQNYGYNGSDGNWLRHSFLNVVNQYENILGSADAANGSASSNSGSSWLNFQLTYAASNNGMNTGVYQFTLPQDNTIVTLQSAFENGWGVRNHDGNDTGSSKDTTWKDSGYTIKSDGVAPGFDSVSDYQNGNVDSKVVRKLSIDKNLKITGSVDNLFDTGSGVKNVYAEITSSSEPGTVKDVQLVNNNGQWQLPSTDPYTLFKLPYDATVKIHAVDNVGNDGVIFSKKFDLLNISATLSPDPSKEGQAVHLDINTTGFPNNLKIYFPQEITSNDTRNTVFPISKDIPEEYELETKQDYIIPLKTPITIDDNGNRIGQPYNVTIVATREDGKQVQCTVPLDVKDNVLDGLKTEITSHKLIMK